MVKIRKTGIQKIDNKGTLGQVVWIGFPKGWSMRTATTFIDGEKTLQVIGEKKKLKKVM